MIDKHWAGCSASGRHHYIGAIFFPSFQEKLLMQFSEKLNTYKNYPVVDIITTLADTMAIY